MNDAKAAAPLSDDEAVRQCAELVDRVRPLLSGVRGAVAMTVLAELMAMVIEQCTDDEAGRDEAVANVAYSVRSFLE